MALLSATGIEELARELEQEPARAVQREAKMLLAGAEIVQQGWKDTAQEQGFRRTGGLIDAIRYVKKPEKLRDLRYVDVYPQGKDKKGVRYGAIAYILHYGKPGSSNPRARRRKKKFPGAGIPRTLWVDQAEGRSADAAVEAMRRIWTED